MKPERRLIIIIPVVHTYADMGSLRDKIHFNNESAETATTRFWIETFRYLRSLSLDFSCLKVYQDGLPDTSPTIVDKIVAETQTANYEILRWFKEQGVSVLGTENQDLLLEEYRSLRAIVVSSDKKAKTAAQLEYMKKNTWLLRERDNYIAQRIKSTLSDGETGILFIGIAHDVGQFLDKEIQVTNPEEIRHPLTETLRNFYGYGEERK